MNPSTTESRVLHILQICPEARADDMLLAAEYYERYATIPVGNLRFSRVMRGYRKYDLPSICSLRRVRQRVQSIIPDVSSKTLLSPAEEAYYGK